MRGRGKYGCLLIEVAGKEWLFVEAMMKVKIKLAALTLFLITGFPLLAKEDKAGYETCILEHISRTEDALAANLMTHACYCLYIDNFMLAEKDRDYYSCLLEYMPEAKEPEITLQIKRVCNDKYRSLFK